ncbi:NACHT domain-containing protein [Lysinibacillus fusiformis]|uniref:NACHT domain-containing protein n=1 Tax=Lysinibacillus fusiformis TaxID=28031 RepID=UPI0037120D8C
MPIPEKILIDSGSKIITNVIDTWVFPKIKNIKTEIKEVFNLNFKDYINRMYNDSKYINSLVFSKSPKFLEDLYVPLNLISEKEGKIEIYYSKQINDFIEEYNNILIVDTAGMGKTTILKWMFKKSIELNSGIPISIELRKLNKEHTILDEINNGINGFASNIEITFIEKLISEGNFIFYLDGFDEIAPDNVSHVTSNIQGFMSKAYKNKFIITSRDTEALKSFNNFHMFHIEKLKVKTSESLLRKYALADKGVENTEELIIELKRRKSLLKGFLETPLMVALLYKGYDYRKNIPIKKSLFYRQVYDALFQDHDMSKSGAFSRPKKSMLDIEDFHTLVNALGFITFKHGLLGFSKEELIKYIKQSIELSGIEAPISGVIEDLTDNVPLMHKISNEYIWNHKSLQEYFAAKFICLDVPNEQEKILNNIYKTRDFQKFETLLSFCQEIKQPFFNSTIVSNFLKEVDNYHKSFEIEYKDCENYRKLLRQLIFDNEFVLIGLKKETIKDLNKDKWDNETNGADEEEKYKKYAFLILITYMTKRKNYPTRAISVTLREYKEFIFVIGVYNKEFKPLLDLFKTKNESFIFKEDFEIPKPNLEKFIEDDLMETFIEVLNDEIDEESFNEETIWNTLSIIYHFTKLKYTYINYDKVKETLENSEEKPLSIDLFDFS